MKITQKAIEWEGKEILEYSLSNSSGIEVTVLNYGGILSGLKVVDKNNTLQDIVLGFDSPHDYLSSKYIDSGVYFGAIVGRYANRIEKGCFQLNGKKYTLAVNNGPNHLHGGLKGFDKVIWDTRTQESDHQVCLYLTYKSEDMEEGYPGNLDVEIAYTLNDLNELSIEYRAKTDKDTHVNLTNHSYFNLEGRHQGDIREHQLSVFASRYTPSDETLIPTGEYRSVTKTPFDFREEHAIGDEIDELKDGYDLNFVLDDDSILKPATRLYSPKTGICMDVATTQPGVQIYTGYYIPELEGSNGEKYHSYSGVAIETQHFPNTPNNDKFPSTLLTPDREYYEKTIYKIDVCKN